MDKKSIKSQLREIKDEKKALEKRQSLLNKAEDTLTQLLDSPEISNKEIPGVGARGGRKAAAKGGRKAAAKSARGGRKAASQSSEKQARGGRKAAKKSESRSLALIDTSQTDGRRRQPGQPTARDQIRDFMSKQRNPIAINEVREAFPQIKKSLVYATMSALARGGEFKRDGDGNYVKA